MPPKTAIVTGASSGFGLSTVIQLAKRDFNVIASMRDFNKAEKLLTLAKEEQIIDRIHLQSLDVTSPLSIQNFKQSLISYQSIDVLVNNAGFALGGFSEELSVADYQRQFDTNFFGVIAVTQAVLPIMRAQKHGRIINMSSISGFIGFPGLSPYVASKHALEGFSESLRLEVKPFGIDVVVIEPGSYKTNIWSSIDALEINEDSPYHFYMSALLKEMETGKAKHGDPLEVAKLVATLASQKKTPKLRYPIGKGVKRNQLLKKVLPWKQIEKTVLRILFKS